MSLYRFRNIEDLNLKTGPRVVTDLNSSEYKLLDLNALFVGVETINEGSIYTESHIYTDTGDYIKSVYNVNLLLDHENNSLFLNSSDVFSKAGIKRGYFKVISNFLLPVFGNPNFENNGNFFIHEISPDRTEIKFVLNEKSLQYEFGIFKDLLFSFDFEFIFNYLVLNFYQNHIYRVINVRFDKNDKNVFYVKLYSPLSEEIDETRFSWFGLEVIDTYVDDFLIEAHTPVTGTKKIKGPNFYLQSNLLPSNQTMYKNWNDLLDSDLETTQNILDRIFNSSKQAILNIDYTNFKNFVFYSKASTRLEIFKTKMELLENYNTQINSFSNEDVYSSLNKNKIINRKNKLKENFDSFERWLYYQPTGSIFTHDIDNILTPYPKYESNGKIIYNNLSDQVVIDWFETAFNHANEFDLHNYNCLINTVPEYLLLDNSNSSYLTFIEMVGHHFDNLYMYVKSLNQIHERDEHPERGFSNNLLYPIAKSFGWELQDVNSISELWNYKLGTDSTGSLVKSNGLNIIPHENQTKNVWRRIVNNLPLLLKTKGSKTSITALMSIYGIPQTLLSVKEYGGPGINPEKPIIVSNNYSYKLKINSGSFIKVPQDRLTVANFGWGRGSICKGEENPTKRSRLPDTYEFRFTTRQANVSGSIPLFVQVNEENEAYGMLSLVSSAELDGTEIISGSRDYGKLLYETTGSNSDYQYSEYLPLFDGDMWTVKIEDIRQYLTNQPRIKVSIGRSKDCLRGSINHYDTFILNQNSINLSEVTDILLVPPPTGFDINFNRHVVTGSFDGSIQGYKEYFTIYNEDVFFNHIRNPKAYNTNTPSGSFYSLYRYYPLGLDLKRYNHAQETEISSSHPDQKHHQPTPAEFINFTGDIKDQYIYMKETYYAEVPKVGNENIYSNKLRIESATLDTSLQVDRKREIGEYDKDSPDSNRLIIAFSTANQINNDIVDHMGFTELDDFFGEPSEEFNNTYKDLNTKTHEYFQKYPQKNDINSLIRVLSLYDYTFFEQIKQLVPAKADLISGILIEPHVLERSKVQISKKPNISTHHYDEVIDYSEEISGEIQNIEGNVDRELDLLMEYQNISGDFNYQNPLTFADYLIYKGLIVEKILGTGENIEPIINPHKNCIWKRKVCHFTGYTFYKAINKNPRLFTDTVGLSFYDINSECLVDKNSSYDINDIFNIYNRNIFYQGVKLEGLDRENSFKSIMAQDVKLTKDGNNKYILQVFAISDPFHSESKIEISVDDENPVEYTVKANVVDGKYVVNEYRYVFSGSYKETKNLKIIALEGDVIIFSFAVHNYYDEYDESVKRMYHRWIKFEKSCQLETWYYQYNENSKKNNFRFSGSKLTGPGINIDSKNTIDKGPVVEVRTTNPNQFNVGFGDSDGNIKVG